MTTTERLVTDLHHLLSVVELIPGVQPTRACSQAVRLVKNFSQTRHLRTSRPKTVNNLANMVAADGACASLDFVVSSRVDQQ